ncbi:MAG TPA: hypothetical protein VFH40_01305 [Gemmatimonadales bacterium]|nr:hypothetical protein [Gemmatimonadales bacterium]
MTHLYQLARRTARLRGAAALILAVAFTACNQDRLAGPVDNLPPGVVELPAPSFSSGYQGGIPFGYFHQPTTEMGGWYSGGMRNILPENLLTELRAIKDRGAKVMLNLAGAPARYIDGSGHFSMTMWKASTDRFKDIDFSAYVLDGTVIGNFLLDEPNDPDNWNGLAVSPAIVDEMAHYSKSRWPTLPTVIRARPTYFPVTPKYLDAAWAQYHSKFGDPARFVAENISAAKDKGLALVVGFNILKGNDGTALSASQIDSWGAALMANDYPCAFLSWRYEPAYSDRAAIAQAMESLSSRAANHPSRSCRGTAGQTTGSTPPPSGSPTPPPPQPIVTSPVTLSLDRAWASAGRQYVTIRWSGARTGSVDVYRDGAYRKSILNDGRQTFWPLNGRSSYTFKVCEKSSSVCSNTVTARF